jgi:hypothetical protein
MNLSKLKMAIFAFFAGSKALVTNRRKIKYNAFDEAVDENGDLLLKPISEISHEDAEYATDLIEGKISLYWPDGRLMTNPDCLEKARKLVLARLGS